MLLLHHVELTCQPLSESMRCCGDELNLLLLLKKKNLGQFTATNNKLRLSSDKIK